MPDAGSDGPGPPKHVELPDACTSRWRGRCRRWSPSPARPAPRTWPTCPSRAARRRRARPPARDRRLRHRPGDLRGPVRRRARRRGPLVLGHELLGRVERDGAGFARGDLVTATVRRSCGRCVPCAQGAPDSCDTGDYLERGITRLHGFARELVAEAPEHLVPVPASLGRLGVLAEPASVCERGLRHVRARSAPASPGGRGARSSSARARSACCHLPAADGGPRGLGRAPRDDAHKERLVGACGARPSRPTTSRCATWRTRSAASTSCSRPRATPRSCSTLSASCAATASPACSASTGARAT